MFSKGDIDFDDINSDIVTFFSNEIGLKSINLNKINFMTVNLTIMILKLLIMLDL